MRVVGSNTSPPCPNLDSMHNGWVDVWLSWCNEDDWPLSATAMQFGLCGTGFPNLTGMANLSLVY
jgi:hypothetical protein